MFENDKIPLWKLVGTVLTPVGNWTVAGAGSTLSRTNIATVNTINNLTYSQWSVMTGTSSTIVLTGVGAQPDGSLLYVTNVAAPFLLLAQENTSSLAANRLDNASGINLKLYAAQSAIYGYDTSISRYRMLAFMNPSQGNQGQINFSDGDGNWDNDGGNYTYIKSSNRVQATNSYTTTEQDIGVSLRLLFANLGDGGILHTFTTSSSGFVKASDPADFFYDPVTGRTGLGTASPGYRLVVISADNTLADPTSFAATVTPESLLNPPSADSLSLVYGPNAPTGGTASENDNSGSVYTAAGQNWDYLFYPYSPVNGVTYTSVTPMDVNFVESFNDGSNFTVSLNMPSPTNGDGSPAAGYILYIPGLGTYTDIGNVTSYLDDGTAPGGASLNPFFGFTSSAQTFTYDLAAVGVSPSGNPYYNDNGGTNVFSITDLYGNGSLFWISHTILGSGGNNWREIENGSGGFDGTGDQQFYETTPYSGTNTLSPQHYGIQATGSSNLNSDWELYSRNGIPIYSTGFLTASTVDPGDLSYQYVAFTFTTPTGGGKILQSPNSGGFAFGQIVSGTSLGYDALGPAFTDGTGIAPISTPNSTTFLQNTSTSKNVPILILNAENTLGGVPAIAFQNNGTTQALLYSTGANVTTDGVMAASQFNGSGAGLSSLNAGNVSTGILGQTFGGTGFSTYAIGDTIYSSASNTLSKLSGNTTATKKFLTQTGTGSASAAPVWNTIAVGDIPTLNQNTSGSAASLTTGRTISITGDLAYTSASFNGSGNVTGAGTLATVNSNVGSFSYASVTVNAKGLITAASNGTAPLSISASADLTAITGATTITTFANPAANHTYRVGAYINVTAVTLDVAQVQVAYNDENSNSVTATFFPQGLTSANIASTGNFPLPPMDIRVKASTTITLKTILTTGTGSISYDCGGSIIQLT